MGARNRPYTELERFLSRCSRTELHSAFSEPWLNDLVPGIKRILGCDQGRNHHLEGDVGVHTAIVFENLILTARRRMNREADFIERVSVLLHDLRKPDTRVESRDGSVSFPNHERGAASDTLALAERLGLTREEQDRLLFLVERHGDAHGFPNLSSDAKSELKGSPFIVSLALLQEADALSCIRKDGTTLPVHWELLVENQ